jgi:hemerythrin-like domain-containing protein
MFNQIHKALRALLCETAQWMQQTDFWNVDEATPVIERVYEVIEIFEKHANTEDSLVFPAIVKFEPSVVDAFEKEHVKDHELGELLASSLEGYERAAIITEKAAAAQQVQAAFMKFAAFNLEHMGKEEEIINPLLWRYYKDEELQAITRTIVSSIPPDHAAMVSKWMLRGMNNPEIASWLREVERVAPEPVFQALFSTAERELPEKRFRLVIEAMTGGAMVA